MRFNYEIPVEEFVSAQIIFHTARDKNMLIKRGLSLILAGIILCLAALFRYPDFGPLLLFLVAACLVWAGISNLLPQRHFRRYYPQSDLNGKSYLAEVDESGFLVSGDSCTWRVAWTEVRSKGEDKRVFAFHAKGTIFIFGKKYLTSEQQSELRRFL